MLIPGEQPVTNFTDDFKVTFGDYGHFEGDPAERSKALREFVMGKTYGVYTRYPKLDFLYDLGDGSGDEKLTFAEKKQKTYEAIYELTTREQNGELTPEVAKLYIGGHTLRLKKMMLIEASRHVLYPGTSSEDEVARNEYMSLNREVFGEMDKTLFDGIMHTEQERTNNFIARNDRAQRIKEDLEGYYSTCQFEAEEQPLLSEEVMPVLYDAIISRYGDVLSVVPETGSDTYYDAEECREIMQRALEAGKLAEHGWTIVVDPKKSSVSASTAKTRIMLPSSTRRNAGELGRLIAHEQEVHARRGQNGIDSGYAILKSGTADYADAEEGLGVLFECILAGNFDNPSYHRARDRYITAGLAYGTDGRPKDGRETFEILWRILAVRGAENGIVDDESEAKAKQQAKVHVENAFRSTMYDRPGVFYTKLKIYLEGLKKNADYFAANLDNLDEVLDIAMIGKYNHTDPVESQLVRSLVQQSTSE
jgi:hypothetical protein